MVINKMASSVDPDDIAHNEPSHLDLHCLHTIEMLSSYFTLPVSLVNICDMGLGSGPVWRRCRLSYVTGVSN